MAADRRPAMAAAAGARTKATTMTTTMPLLLRSLLLLLAGAALLVRGDASVAARRQQHLLPQTEADRRAAASALPRLPEGSRWLATRRGGLFGKQPPPPATVAVKAAPAKKKHHHKKVSTSAASPGVDPQVAYRQAVRRTLLAVGAACAFGVGLYVVEGKTPAMEFFAGYLIEESLSVDNIFVFIMLFEYFKVPAEYQPRALTWGIIGAVAMRGAMIFLGVAAIQRFRWVVLLFAGILLGSAFKLLVGGEEDGDLSDNAMLKVAGRMVNAVDTYDGDRFFTTKNGKRFATPLFMCLLCIELSDFVFAVDSIPAVLGVSKDPLIVYSSNIFAIMALRSLYTLVATAVNTLEYIKPAVALVLAFVGIKMGLEFFHIEVPISASLGVVVSILGGGIGLSLLKQRLYGNGNGNGNGNGKGNGKK